MSNLATVDKTSKVRVTVQKKRSHPFRKQKATSGIVCFPTVIVPGWPSRINKTAHRFSSCTVFTKAVAPRGR